MKPRLLDLFCGAGGAAMGYHRAGFDVTGVDNVDQPRYPFPFIQADALTFPLDGYDAIHASPPCQDHSALRPDLPARGTGWMLAATIERLRTQPAPWIVENVPGSGAEMGGSWFVLCGASFGLNVDTGDHGVRWLKRHRLFASDRLVLAPTCECLRSRKVIGVYGNGDGANTLRVRGWVGSAGHRRAVMDIDWMSRRELAQAIPPAYTEWIGRQLLLYVGELA